jgi:hypothetical protein
MRENYFYFKIEGYMETRHEIYHALIVRKYNYRVYFVQMKRKG